MDVQAPTLNTKEPRERVVSIEPSTTRPNPFDDSSSTSRKRRRTSPSDSPARSTGTSRELSSSTADGDTPENAIMVLDSESPSPRTPEAQTSESDPLVAPASSSKVTLNLRHTSTANPGYGLADSAAAAATTATSTEAESPVLGHNADRERSDAADDAEMMATTSSESSSSCGSADIEVIEDDEDDDDSPDGFQNGPGSILDQSALIDPCLDIPYLDRATETLVDGFVKILGYFHNTDVVDRSILSDVASWLERCADYFESVEPAVAEASYARSREVWRRLPDFVSLMYNRRPYLQRINVAHPVELLKMLCACIKLTASFAELDTHELSGIMSGRNDGHDLEPRSPELLRTFAELLDPRTSLGNLNEASPATDRVRTAALDHIILREPGLSMEALIGMARLQVGLVARFPVLVESLASTVLMAALETGMAGPEGLEKAMDMFLIVSSKLGQVFEKCLVHKSSDHIMWLVRALSDLHVVALRGRHPEAAATMEQQRQLYPGVLSKPLLEGAVFVWRFDVLEKLVRSNQMQVRVQALSMLCDDLVRFWRTNQDRQHDPAMGPWVRAHINHVAESGLIEYLLGPTCHPEIMAEGANIVGLLAISRTYTRAHCDLFWERLTTTQDPRVCQALVRMMNHIVGMLEDDVHARMCEQLQGLDVAEFSAPIRSMCDVLFRSLSQKHHDQPHFLLLRLLRGAFRYSPRSQVAHQVVADWAMAALEEQALRWTDPTSRRTLALQCIEDVAAKSPTTLGSLAFLFTGFRHGLVTDIWPLAAERDLTRLLMDELEHAIQSGREAGYPAVLSHGSCSPRRGLVELVLLHRPETVTAELGRRLWDMLVGPDASCVEDRDAGWQILNCVADVGRSESQDEPLRCSSNPFLATCLSDHLHTLPSSCFCEGALEFLKRAVVARVGEESDALQLDDEGDLAASGIDQLWRMVLTADSERLAEDGIKTLVCNVYLDNRLAIRHAHQRLRQIHLSVADRCLGQLRNAASYLKSFEDGTVSGDDEPMVVVATEEQVREQERIFSRSLQLLSSFQSAHQVRPRLASQDLGSYKALSPPASVLGDPAGIRYQSFDGDKSTQVLPLSLGLQNSAASLLSSIKDATGFDNYRLFWRGAPLEITDAQICQSLEELKLHDCVLLVKKEALGSPIPERTRPGASLLQVEILSHFQELWGYLELKDELACKVYRFLKELPADGSAMERFENESLSHQDIFPPGQTYKCLYMIYALYEHLLSLKTQESVGAAAGTAPDHTPMRSALARAFRLVAAAIADSGVAAEAKVGQEQQQQQQQHLLLSHHLVELLGKLVSESEIYGFRLDGHNLEPPPLDRLLAMATVGPVTVSPELELAGAASLTILGLCFAHPGFWQQFQVHTGVPALINYLLVVSPAEGLRSFVAKSILAKVCEPTNTDPASNGPAAATKVSFAKFMRTVLIRLVPEAAKVRHQSKQLLQLLLSLLQWTPSDAALSASMAELAGMCCQMLLEHATTEDLGQWTHRDIFVAGLAQLLELAMSHRWADVVDPVLPPGLAMALAKKHLFPGPRECQGDPVPRSVIHTETRVVLYRVVLEVIRRDRRQLQGALQQLDDLVPYRSTASGDEAYVYPMGPPYERLTGLRAPCGYVGLRNLSNTCYLNSLTTQLFMNVGFRRFMMSSSTSSDSASMWPLVFETQKLFANMQESHSRSVDPSGFVAAIKTYDETHIDVNNQMDVDEFYNLLFDRWEAHLAGAEERKTLRSFYGGQLVQQVKSKECDHVSTRTESFQAIQCDIQGKSTLEESLQAYVDGEILAGENKYKCSMCNREVDAVKRACLKEIPDNLIFHLKRFDFNLRTMQRAKINDHFAFPATIDMRPYTMEYLDNADTDAADGAAASEPDVFELVGVLVHSGTAESGHYYSFVRERPSNWPDGSTSWVQFNDEVVSPWDPARLEDCTFGGTDRSRFDMGSSPRGDSKYYSAYMLFYERASVLARHQAEAVESRTPSPLKVEVPAVMVEPIRNQNTLLLRQHCIQDSTHVRFVQDVFGMTCCSGADGSADGGCPHQPHRAGDDVAMDMALGHLDQVVARTKEIPDAFEFAQMLMTRIKSCEHCALACARYFGRNPDVIRYLVQKHPDLKIRAWSAELYLMALRTVRARLPDMYYPAAPDDDNSVLAGVATFFSRLWSNFHANSRTWRDTFGLVLQFAEMGRKETALLLENDWLLNLMRIVWVPQHEMTHNYQRMLSNINKPGRPPPHYDTIFGLMLHLMKSLKGSFDDGVLEDPRQRATLPSGVADGDPEHCRLPWTVHEVNLLHIDPQGRLDGASGWLDKLILLASNQERPYAAAYAILAHLVNMSEQMDAKAYQALSRWIDLSLDSDIELDEITGAAAAWCLCTRLLDFAAALMATLPPLDVHMPVRDSQAVINFYRTVLGGSRRVRPLPPMFAVAMDSLSRWAPDFLTHGTRSIRAATEQLINDYLLCHGIGLEGTATTTGVNNDGVVVIDDDDEDEDEDEDDMTKQDLAKISSTVGCRLALGCLRVINRRYVQADKQPSRDVMDRLRNITLECGRFFEHLEPGEDDEEEDPSLLLQKYQIGVASILEPLCSLASEELEDDGSDWETRSALSGMIDVADELGLQMVDFEANGTDLVPDADTTM